MISLFNLKPVLFAISSRHLRRSKTIKIALRIVNSYHKKANIFKKFHQIHKFSNFNLTSMPVKVLQKIRDQAILVGPRPPQTGDRHFLVAVVHDEPMIVRLHPHFTPLLIVSLKTRKIPRIAFNKKVRKIVDTVHFTNSLAKFFSLGE